MQACPRDKENLVVGQVHGLQVSHCNACSGLWLPPALVATAVGHLPIATVADVLATEKRCLCPQDGAQLRPVFHRGVEIDVCTECGGVWLDQGELELILRCKRIDHDGRFLDKLEGFPELAIELGSEVLTDGDLRSTVGEFAGEALGAVLSFVAEALSGL